MAEKKAKAAHVRRITVDEKLFDDLIRLEVCHLVEGADSFGDVAESWRQDDDPDGLLVNPANYADRMGIPEKIRKKFPWKDLGEGQVFISGSFARADKEDPPRSFTVDPGREDFVRIDEATKKDIQKLYSEAIKRSG